MDEIVRVRMEEIDASPEFNCRGIIVPIDVKDLADSIRTQGLIQPIVVQEYSEEDKQKTGKNYQLLAGFRRHKAHIILEEEYIEAIIKKDLTQIQARILNLSENLQRNDLNVLQEAQALAGLKKLGCGRDEAARALGQSTGWVQVRFMVLELDPMIQKEIAAGLLTQQQIRDLYSLRENREIQFEKVRKIKEAKERGEKTPGRLVRKKASKKSKKKQGKLEIDQMKEHIQEIIGNNFGTRCLAWAGGEISNEELLNDVKMLAEDEGLLYREPVWLED